MAETENSRLPTSMSSTILGSPHPMFLALKNFWPLDGNGS